MESKYNGYSFPLRDTVRREKVKFHNRYGIELAGDLYLPQDATGKLAAVAVSGPFGAVKEQCSGLYAEELASRGFAALAFDPSFIGESGGAVRNVASPDINTEDFSAAVDFLATRDFVDGEKIGILGICGFGGMALNAAAMDTRIKATVTSTMYDMSRVNAKGYFDSTDSADARYEMKQALNAQRTRDYQSGTYARAGGVVDPLPEDAPFFLKDYYDYYKTQRGYTERSLNSNDGWNVTSSLSFVNMPILHYTNEIRSAVLMLHGEKAHSCYFSRDAFAHMVDGNPYSHLPDDVRETLQSRMDATRQMFAQKVSAYTGLSVQAVLDTEAAVYSGQEAIDAGLADELVNSTDAITVMREALDARKSRLSGGRMTKETQSTTVSATASQADVTDVVSATEGENASAAQPDVNAQITAAVAAENSRIMGILNCEEAHGREEQARVLAETPGMTVETARRILAAAPQSAQARSDTALDRLMQGAPAPLAAGNPASDAVNDLLNTPV